MRSLFAIASLAAIAAACASAPPASAETKGYNFNAFNKLDISAGYTVIFTQGSQRSVTIESDDFSKVFAEQNGDTLRIGRPRNTNINKKDGPDIVRITAPDLKSAELNAGVDFRADNLNVGDLVLDVNAGVKARFDKLKAKNVTLDLNAGVDVRMSGECSSIRVDAQAGVQLDAEDLKCESARVDAGVGSQVSVRATNKVVAEAGLGAQVQVAGKPRDVEQHASMGGKVTISR
ncbi:MAG TPA: DUF2807 domain-containing protein [Hyphomonadaceae bacterium]|jgi:hypothetical protein|nr:DUF2807 domain-containing protein [Hyphomonadaceae bacterium]